MKTSVRIQVQRHLAKGLSLTPLSAYRRFRTLSLSQRIGELKREGWPIESKIVNVGGQRVAQYRFAK